MELSEAQIELYAGNLGITVEEYKANHLPKAPKVGDFLREDDVRSLITGPLVTANEREYKFGAEENITKELTKILKGSNWSVRESGAGPDDSVELSEGSKKAVNVGPMGLLAPDSYGSAVILRSEGGVERKFILDKRLNPTLEQDMINFLKENPKREETYEPKKEEFKTFLNQYFTREKVEEITGKEFLINVKSEDDLKKKIKQDLGYKAWYQKDARTKFPELTDTDIDHIISEKFNEEILLKKQEQLNILSSKFLTSLKNGEFKDSEGNDLKTQENFFENYRKKLIETFDNEDEANLATINMQILHGGLEGDDLDKKIEERNLVIQKIKDDGGKFVTFYDVRSGNLIQAPQSRDAVYKEEERVNVENDIKNRQNKIKLEYNNRTDSNGNSTILSFVEDGFEKNAMQISELENDLSKMVNISYIQKYVPESYKNKNMMAPTSLPSKEFTKSMSTKDILRLLHDNSTMENIMGLNNLKPVDGIEVEVDGETRTITSAEEYSDYLNTVKERLKNLKIDQEAYKRMYLLNENATSIEKNEKGGGSTFGIFKQNSRKMMYNSIAGDGAWENLTGTVASEVDIVDRYVETLNELGVPTTADQDNYARRSFGEQVTEGVAGSAGILLEFAVANKVTAALRAAKIFKGGKNFNDILKSATATRYTNKSGVVMTEAQILAKANKARKYNTVESWSKMYLGNSVRSIGAHPIKSFGAKITEGLIEGLKFGFLPSSSEDRLGSFATGFGFGLAGQVLTPILGTIRAHNLTKVMPENAFGRFVINQAPRLDKAYSLTVKTPLAFATGSEVGEISMAMANDAMGLDEVQTFLGEHYSDFSESAQRFFVNAAVGSTFGLTHKATYTVPKTLNGLKAAKTEAWNKNYTKSNKYWVTLPDGTRKSYSKKEWNNLKPKQRKALEKHLTSKPGTKAREKFMKNWEKNYKEFFRNEDAVEMFERDIRRSEDHLDLLDPVLAPKRIEKMYRNQNAHYNKMGAKIQVKAENNNSEYFKANPNAHAKVEYISPEGKLFTQAPKAFLENAKGWKVKQTYNVDKIERGVAPHELGHSGMSILFGTNARLKGDFMRKMTKIAGEIQIDGQRTLKDAMIEMDGKWDGQNRSWENSRIKEWEMFSYLAETLSKPENLRQLQASKAFEKYDKLIESQLGDKLGQKYNFKTYKDIVRFFGDYIKSIEKGTNSLEALKHLDVVIDKTKTGETEALRKAYEKEGVVEGQKALQTRDLNLEIKDLLTKKPEGYKKKITELENLIEKSKLNVEITDKYKQLVTLEKERGATEQTRLLKGRQLVKLRENNKGILTEYVEGNKSKGKKGFYKEVPGSTLTKAEFKEYVENIEFLKILDTYTKRGENLKDVPFNAYLEGVLRGGGPYGGGRLGNILKGLGVDMSKAGRTVSRDAEGFVEKEFAEQGGSVELPGEAKGIELVYELPVKQETIDLITKKANKIDFEGKDYSTVQDLAVSETKKMFGKSTKDKAAFIVENWKTLRDLLPKNLTETTGTATGVENSLMNRVVPKGTPGAYKVVSKKGKVVYRKNVFYKGEGETVKMKDTGAKTGTELQPKIKMDKKAFLNELGIKEKLDGSIDISGMNVKVDRGITTAVLPALINQTGKAITNQIVRAEIKRAAREGWETLVNEIGSGKSDALQSRTLELQPFRDQMRFYKGVQTKTFAALLKQNLEDFKTQKQAVVKTLQQYFGDYKAKNFDPKSQNNFDISNADLKSIGEQISRTFEYKVKKGKKTVTKKIVDATPERIASKAKQAMEFQNSLDGINAKAGLSESLFRLSTEADVITALDVTSLVAKKIVEVYGDGAYEALLARGESGGSGVGKAGGWGDLISQNLKDGHRFSLHESISAALDFMSGYKNSKGEKYNGPLKKFVEGQGDKTGQLRRLIDKKTGEWDTKKLEEAFEVGEYTKGVLKTAVEALREGYTRKENPISHTQVRQWVEIHAGSMPGLIKLSASFAVVPNMSVKAMYKAFGNKPSDYVLEHTTPAQYIKARIYDYIINGGEAKKAAMDLSLRDYHTTLIPEKLDKMVNKTLQYDLPSWHLPGMDPLKSRYYEANHPSDFGLGLKAFAGEHKGTIYDHHKNLNMSQRQKQGRELAKINKQLFPKSLQKATKEALNSRNLKHLENIDAALQKGRLKNKKKRGMSTFDFDETAGISDNFVIATKKGKTKKIASNEWPVVGEAMMKEGWKMDFSDFNKVTNGRPGPLMQKLKNQIKKFGNENVFILTARAPESQKAIYEYLKSEGAEVPLENITGLGNSTGEAKALWMLEKFAEGYNDMYFVDDAISNVKAVKDVLSQLDVKSKVQQALQSSNISKDFNKILEDVTGTEHFKVFSQAKAQRIGAKKNRYKFFGTPGSEDFSGLTTYAFAGEGKKGEAHKKFFEEKLHDPYNRAWIDIHRKKQTISNDYKSLRKNHKEIVKSLKSKIGDYTIEQAIRVHLFDKAGFEIPGLSKRDLKRLTKEVRNDGDLLAYAEGLSKVAKLKDGWLKPKEYWLAENITSDLNNVVDRVYRKEAMAEFIQNREAIFGKWENGKLIGDNMNKIEALYGTKHRDALDNMIWRMENFTNRSHGTDANTAKWMNWVNNASSTIMFFNQKSAMLQTISNVNYINGKENNPFAAARAFANQPQYWKDFMNIMNSDMLVQRRAGLKINVEAAEIIERVAGGKNTAGRAISVLLEKGFIPTKYADSFAISLGGATYYRNRAKMYQEQGLSLKKAEAKAWEDFSMLTEKTQQSSRPDLISSQQASALGRPILSFANTPMQMFRRHKRRIQDIASGRGNMLENILSSVYYGFVQTMIFSYLSNAMFAVDEETTDPEKQEFNETKKLRYTQTIADSYLRGMGTGGATISALKNSIITVANESEKPNPKYYKAVIDLLNVSPPIGSKARKLVSAGNTYAYNKRAIERSPYLSLSNPAVHANSQIISALTNIPADRVVEKAINISDASNSDYENWQRIAMFSGMNKWSLGLRDEYRDFLNRKIKRSGPKLPKLPKAPKLPNP